MTDDQTGSLREFINGNLRRKHAATIEKISVPRFNGRLVLRCRSLDPKTRLEMSLAATPQEGEQFDVNGLIDGAITALVKSCIASETEIDGVIHDLPPLGVALSQFLGADAECGMAQADEEAAIEVFRDVDDLVEAANDLRLKSEAAGEKVQAEIQGNSEATG